ncbi:MAG: ribbon-helix-helix protein, CopG family [Ruminiclostridium sp.]
MDEKLKITKVTKFKGEDGYKTFSIRVKDEIVSELDKLSEETGRSRNELIGIMLEFGIANCEIV